MVFCLGGRVKQDDSKRTQYVKELAEYLRERFAKQKKLIKLMRELRAMQHTVEVPEDYKTTAKVVRTGKLADTVQRITSTLSVNYPSWQRGLMAESETEKRNTEMVQSWLPAAHLRMESQARRRIFRMLMDAAVSDGMAVSQILWHPEVYDPFPKRKREEMVEYGGDPEKFTARVKQFYRERAFPFSWRDIDPLSYEFYDNYQGEREVILRETVPVGPTATSFGVEMRDGEWLPANPGAPLEADAQLSGETCELIQHWTKNDVVYLLDDRFVKRVEHNYGRQCIWDFAGMATSERAPDRAFLPVTFAFSELIPLLDRLITMKTNWMYLSAFPRAVLKLSETRLKQMAGLVDGAEARGAQFSQNLSKLSSLILLYPDEQFEYANPPNVGVDLNQMIQLVTGMIDEAGMANLLRGNIPSGMESGYLYNQATVSGRLAYDPITDNAKFMLGDQAAFILYAVDKLSKTSKRAGIPVWGDMGGDRKGYLELSPSHINGMYDTEPQLEPLLPSNLIMEGTFGLNQAKGGAISMYTHRKKFLRLNPQEEEKRIAIEEAKMMPAVRQRFLEKTMEEAGLLPVQAPTPPVPPMPGIGGLPMLGPGGPEGAMGPPPPVEQPGMPPLTMPQPTTPGQGMPLIPTPLGMHGVGAPNILPGVGPIQPPGGNYGGGQ